MGIPAVFLRIEETVGRRSGLVLSQAPVVITCPSGTSNKFPISREDGMVIISRFPCRGAWVWNLHRIGKCIRIVLNRKYNFRVLVILCPGILCQRVIGTRREKSFILCNKGIGSDYFVGVTKCGFEIGRRSS